MFERPITVFVVDDHELVRQGLRSMLEQEGDLQVVGECRSAQEAFSKVVSCLPDIVLVEVQGPEGGGISLVTRLRRQQGAATAHAIALAETPAFLPEAMAAGAAGYLLKDIGRRELGQAIREVYSGENSADGAAGIEPFDLVISVPADSSCIMKFMACLEKTLRANIVQTVGSWEQGTIITIMQSHTPFEALPPQLAALPGVLGAEIEVPGEATMAGLIKRVKGLRTSRKRILVTLETCPASQPGTRAKPAVA